MTRIDTSTLEAGELADRLAAIVASSDDAIISKSLEGVILSWNRGAERIFGYTAEEMIGQKLALLIPPNRRNEIDEIMARLRRGDRVDHFETIRRRKDGTDINISVSISPIRNARGEIVAASKVARDITHERASREALMSSLKEKEVLLQEVHHRVKNNLQVISSLINMQVRTLTAGPARHALEECQTRVQAIALIHEKLYQSKNYAKVPFSEYLKGLATNVFQVSGQEIPIELALAIDDTTLAVDRAIPCGLIVNELITNALKHGFKGRSRGSLHIEMSRTRDRVRVAVQDDGVGFPDGLDIQTSPTLGLQLVTTLAEQLEADLRLTRSPGTRFEIEFSAPTGEVS